MPAEGQDTEQWKKKYYDQLDALEQKEQDWEALETIFKRTISRLSLAAEGQHSSLDRHLSELRQSIKNTVNPQTLSSIVEQISDVIGKLEEQAVDTKNPVSQCLQQILSQLELPASCNKPLKKLNKQLDKADDRNAASLIQQSTELIRLALDSLATKADDSADGKGGLIGKLFSTQDTAKTEASASSDIDIYKRCLLHLIDELNTAQSPSGKLSALRVSVSSAKQQQQLDSLLDKLSHFIQDDQNTIVNNSVAPAAQQSETQPAIQEILIRLLEQLIVPADMQSLADDMKHRLEDQVDTADWKLLLKDVASLINTIRSRLQEEKNEFENFLQQVTDRLRALDQFLQQESSQLQAANESGLSFDRTMKQNVDEIQQDIQAADDLSSLKQSVTLKLDTISQHIQSYRNSEKQRIDQSQQQVTEMHSRMQELEQETASLKKVVIEKNRQAMFDTLTGIPNRLSYEKKVEEEIARWKRFSSPLSLAVWDIDFFKKVNDTYGHKAGDKVLKTVAQVLHKRIRATDFLARYGGEEFVMLLPGTALIDTQALLDKLRQEVESCGFHYHGDAVTITASCGASEFQQGDSLSRVFERADQALYQAKKNGRNQCVLSSSL